MNNRFVILQAERFAERLRREAGATAAAQVERAFRLALGRPPDAVERKQSMAFVKSDPDGAGRVLPRAVQPERVRVPPMSCRCSRFDRPTCWSRVASCCESSAAASRASRSPTCSAARACSPQPASANPLAPKPPHFPAKAKAVISIFCYGGVSQVDTFDPKPDLVKWQGETMTGRRRRADDDGHAGRADALAVEVQEARPVRHGGLGAVPARGAARRRHRAHSIDVRAEPGARAGAVSDEHRQHPGRASERRQLGDVRARQREREPAGLHRLHRLSRRSDQRAAELGQRLHAGGLSGHAVPRQRGSHRRPEAARRRGRRTSSGAGCGCCTS